MQNASLTFLLAALMGCGEADAQRTFLYPADPTIPVIRWSGTGYDGESIRTGRLVPVITIYSDGRVETDSAARHAAYRRLDETLLREARLIPLFHEQVYRVARPEVGGLRVSQWTPVVAYEELELIESREEADA